MQATAMTEPLYLALFIWAVVYFAEFIRSLRNNKDADERQAQVARAPLMRCACCLAGAELTRYDGWFLAGVMGAAGVVIVPRRWGEYSFRLAVGGMLARGWLV